MKDGLKTFSVNIATMKITDHSEVIGKMIILETDAWQAASRITQKQTFTKF